MRLTPDDVARLMSDLLINYRLDEHVVSIHTTTENDIDVMIVVLATHIANDFEMQFVLHLPISTIQRLAAELAAIVQTYT